MKSEVERKVREIMAVQAVLHVRDVHPDSSPESLGIDSLGLVESIFAIEDAFNVTVPFNSNNPHASGFDVSSIATIVAAVEVLVAQKFV